MLILTRRPGQSILIGDIRVTMMRIRGGEVVIAIQEPRSAEPTCIFSARPNQPVEVGATATVMVGRIRGDQIRLCIDAPKEIRVLREELVNNACSA